MRHRSQNLRKRFVSVVSIPACNAIFLHIRLHLRQLTRKQTVPQVTDVEAQLTVVDIREDACHNISRQVLQTQPPASQAPRPLLLKSVNGGDPWTLVGCSQECEHACNGPCPDNLPSGLNNCSDQESQDHHEGNTTPKLTYIAYSCECSEPTGPRGTLKPVASLPWARASQLPGSSPLRTRTTPHFTVPGQSQPLAQLPLQEKQFAQNNPQTKYQPPTSGLGGTGIWYCIANVRRRKSIDM